MPMNNLWYNEAITLKLFRFTILRNAEKIQPTKCTLVIFMNLNVIINQSEQSNIQDHEIKLDIPRIQKLQI